MRKLFISLAILGAALSFCFAAATRKTVAVEGNKMILAGTAITVADGTITQAFSTVFSAVPVVVSSQVGAATTISNIVSVTTSNFVLNTGLPTSTNKWVAVGTP
jgi:hypothetical protein